MSTWILKSPVIINSCGVVAASPNKEENSVINVVNGGECGVEVGGRYILKNVILERGSFSVRDEHSKEENFGLVADRMGMESRTRNAVPPPLLAILDRRGKLRSVYPGGVASMSWADVVESVIQVSESAVTSDLLERVRSLRASELVGFTSDLILREQWRKVVGRGPGFGWMSPQRVRRVASGLLGGSLDRFRRVIGGV